MNLAVIQHNNKACTDCGLCEEKHHLQVVPGIGGPSKLMVIAEAPGQDENIMGEPLVGRAGKVFDKMLEASRIERTGIYVTNVVKCRPPDNRPPAYDEIQSCKKWLWQEIQAVKPEYIVTLGLTSSKLLLKNDKLTMAAIFGKEFYLDFAKAILVPCYHPSYVLRKGTSASVFDPCVEIFTKIRKKLYETKKESDGVEVA